uniref:TYRO protein tyrosine kinase-binding protein n=1 Tax=Fundulus heteroclitus TaxID=8078 RepID=A0A3Q2PMI8_FUNHE
RGHPPRMAVQVVFVVLLLSVAAVETQTACENCFELDGYVLMLVILVDVIGTAILMRIIYVCNKGKRRYAPPPPQPGRNELKIPPAGSGPRNLSSAESLNVHTLSSDTYSTMNTGMVNRMG